MKQSKYSFLMLFLFLLTMQSSARDSLEVVMTFEMPEDSIRFLPHYGGDYNNDGYDDLLYTYYNRFSGETRLQFYFGSSVPKPVPDYEFEIDIGFVGQPGWAGDLNNDGYKEITLSVTNGWPYCCDIYIFFGNDNYTIDPDSPDKILYGQNYSGGAQYSGGNSRNVDFNGDGYADIIASSSGPEMFFNGQVDIFFGGEAIDSIRDFHIQGNVGNEFGLYKAVGDINGDGFDDLIVSRNMQQFEGPFMYEIYLGKLNMDTVKDYEIIETYDKWLTYPCANGDINNDGYDDLIIPTNNVNIYFGTQNGKLSLNDQIEHSYDITHLFYCDINNDGFSDICISIRNENRVYIYYGSAEFDIEPDIILEGDNPEDYFGEYGCNLGDFNGDGKNEIIIDDGTPHNRAKVYTLAEKSGIKNKNTNQIYNNLLINSAPNPFINNTSISFSLRHTSFIQLDIYNIRGRRVKSLYNQRVNPGTYVVSWDGRSDNGNFLADGIYLVRLRMNKCVKIRKIMKVRY